jgi:hypothetical protein
MNCVQVARSSDLNGVLKTMYRVRGETNRIDIADGLGRVAYAAVKMEAEFDTMISAIRQCLKIRNRYAHAYWHDPSQGNELCYVSLEELAKEPDEIVDLTALTFFFIDEYLLLSQEKYFEYTRDLITYINYEGRQRTGVIKQQIFPLPKPLAVPPAFTRKGR